MPLFYWYCNEFGNSTTFYSVFIPYSLLSYLSILKTYANESELITQSLSHRMCANRFEHYPLTFKFRDLSSFYHLWPSPSPRSVSSLVADEWSVNHYDHWSVSAEDYLADTKLWHVWDQLQFVSVQPYLTTVSHGRCSRWWQCQCDPWNFSL